MGDPLQHVQPGQPFRVSAVTHNAMLDAARTVREGRVIFSPGESTPAVEGFEFPIHNLSGEEIPPYGCVELVSFAATAGGPSDNDVGTDRGHYWAGVKPFSWRGTNQGECERRKFAFNGSSPIAVNDFGRVRRATPKKTRCLIEPRAQTNQNFTFKSPLAPIPNTWYLGCGEGFRFAGYVPEYPFRTDFDWENDPLPQCYVIEDEGYAPFCPFTHANGCLDVTLPELTAGGVTYPGGTYKLACCSGEMTCAHCTHWLNVPGDAIELVELTLPQLSDIGTPGYCLCPRPILHLRFDNGDGKFIDAWWQCELGYLESWHGANDVQESIQFIGSGLLKSGTGGGVSGSVPADVTVTRDPNCLVGDPTLLEDCGTPPEPPEECGGTITYRSQKRLFYIEYPGEWGCEYYWGGGPGGMGSPSGEFCFHEDPCTVCGPPTAEGEECTVDVIVTPWNTDFNSCRTECEPDDGINCVCPGECQWIGEVFTGGGGQQAVVWTKIVDCITPPPEAIGTCNEPCECEDATSVWGAPTLGEEGVIVSTPCNCTDDACDAERLCTWQWEAAWVGIDNECEEGETCSPPEYEGEPDEIAFTACVPE